MMPSDHMFYGFFAALIALFLVPDMGAYGFLLIFLGSVLIDFDHYLYYAYSRKDISFSNAVEYYIRLGREQSRAKKVAKEPLMIFHTLEFWILLLVFSFVSDFFLYVLIGMLVHVVLDVIEMRKKNMLHIRAHSIIRHYLRK